MKISKSLFVLAFLALQTAHAAPWINAGPLNAARHSHTATLLLDGKVLVAGGAVSAALTNAADLYDPTTGKCQPTGFMTEARRNGTATLLLNGKVLVAGGFNLSNLELSSAELYDPATGQWTPTGAMNGPREFHTATLLPNGTVLVAGGLTSTGAVSSAEIYDPAAGTWHSTGSMSTNRVLHTATLLANGRVLLAGGGGLGTPKQFSSFQFEFAGTSGGSYTAVATTNISLAQSNWTTLGPISEVSPGQFRFIDPQAANNPRRLYRVRSP